MIRLLISSIPLLLFLSIVSNYIKLLTSSRLYPLSVTFCLIGVFLLVCVMILVFSSFIFRTPSFDISATFTRTSSMLSFDLTKKLLSSAQTTSGMFCGITCHLDPLATFELYINSRVILNEVGASPSSCFNPESEPNLIASCCCHFNEYNQFRWKFKFREYFYSNPPTNKNLMAINFMFPTFPQCLFH